MWKCKKCGGIIKGYYIGFIDIDEKGCAIDDTQEEEELIKYICEDCEEEIKIGRMTQLKKIADWEEEDERD